MKRRGGGKPPFPTCQLKGVELFHSTLGCSQVWKGVLPPPTYHQLNVQQPSISLKMTVRYRRRYRPVTGLMPVAKFPT